MMRGIFEPLMRSALPVFAGPSPRTIAKRKELTAAWRIHRPAPFRLSGEGPRPASTYRAARRNARRWLKRVA